MDTTAKFNTNPTRSAEVRDNYGFDIDPGYDPTANPPAGESGNTGSSGSGPNRGEGSSSDIITALFTLANGMLAGQQARSQQGAAERFAWDQFDEQKKFTIDMWLAQNAENQRLINDERAFNDPAAVRKRFEAAGYSPQVPFGVTGSYRPSTGAAGSGGGTPSAPNTSPNYAPLPFRLDPSSFADVMLKMAQAKNLEANTQRTVNETQTREQFNEYTELKNKSLALSNELSKANIHLASENSYRAALDNYFTALERPIGLKKEKQALHNMKQQGHNLLMDMHRAVTAQKLDQAQLELVNRQADIATLNVAISQIKLDYADQQEMADLAAKMAQAGSFTASINLLEAQIENLPTPEQADAINELNAIRAQMESGNWSRALFRVREFLSTFGAISSGMDAAGQAVGREAGKTISK